MSTQLVIFPQFHNGRHGLFSTNPNEFVVNGITFAALSTGSSYDSPNITTPTLDVMTNAPPTVANTWFRYRTTTGGTPALPTNTLGDLHLNSIAALTTSGVYQELSNLTVGQAYTVTISISFPSTGVLAINLYNGTTQNGGANLFQASVSSHTHTFTAASTNDVIFLSYLNNLSTNVVISQISVVPQGTTPSGIDELLSDGQLICDLYADEDIPLTLSVDDFKNVAEKVQSYSKAFKLPATKRNNLIFSNIFEVTRSDDGLVFNPYVKTKSVLKQDGFVLFEGYMKLIDIQDKNGEVSYNVNLYSATVAVAEILKQRSFRDLDFSELNHDYTRVEIVNSWTGILNVPALPITSFANNTGVAGATTTNVLAYPFVDWAHSLTVDPFTDQPNLPNLESTFRPFIKIKYLLQRIFAETDFSFTSSFFDTADFTNLYMDFNWGDENVPMIFNNTGVLINQTGSTSIAGGASFLNLKFPIITAAPGHNFNYDVSTGVFTAVDDNQYFDFDVNFSMFTSVGAGTMELEWVHSHAAGETIYSPVSGVAINSIQNLVCIYTTTFSLIAQTGDTIFWRGRYTSAGIALCSGSNTGTTVVTMNTNAANTTTDSLLQTLRGELGQWEFIQGIMTMFNLIAIPDESNQNNILIEPYKDIFLPSIDGTPNFFDNNSKTLDWTDKMDIGVMKLKPLTDLKKRTVFKFEEDDDDYIFNVYKGSVGGHLYGSKTFDASTSSQNLETIFTGSQDIVASPFAATVIKPLMTQYSDLIVPSIYAFDEKTGESEPFDNSPRIMFNNGVKTLNPTSPHVPAQNGVSDLYLTSYLQFSHLSSIPTVTSNPPVSGDTRDFNFGDCQLINPVGNAVPSNLFYTYWLPYYAQLYNPDTRTLSMKVNIAAGELNTFNFYDRVVIKNREYSVNKIDYKPNGLASVEFILII